MRARSVFVLIAAIAASTISVTAQQTAPPAQSIISGLALASNNTPLPNFPVHLRNLETKKIEQRGVTNRLGEFVFVAQPKVPYVIEIADHTGRVFAASDVVTVQTGEVAGAMVSIPGPLPALSGLFHDTATSVLSAASGSGLTAIQAAPAPKLSPEE